VAKKSGFNSPFAGLDKKLAQQESTAKAAEAKAAEARAAADARAAAEAAARRAAEHAEREAARAALPADRLFEEAMYGVQRLDRSTARVPQGQTSAPRSPRAAAVAPAGPSTRTRDDAEADAVLADLVAGTGAFALTDAGDHVEGLAPGCDRRLLRKLKRGDYLPDARVDLHGRNQSDARRELERALKLAVKAGHRCLLVIHGQGHNSAAGEPVLKPALPEWLTSGAAARAVLAFTAAPPEAGGAGATLVLLRRSQ